MFTLNFAKIGLNDKAARGMLTAALMVSFAFILSTSAVKKRDAALKPQASAPASVQIEMANEAASQALAAGDKKKKNAGRPSRAESIDEGRVANSGVKNEPVHSGALTLPAAPTAEFSTAVSEYNLAHSRARGYAARGEYAAAAGILQNVLAQDAKNFAAHNNLGNICFLQNRLDSAAAYYAKALRLASTADDRLGLRLNLGALWHAVAADTLAATTIAEALGEGDDLPRSERLLALQLRATDLMQASAEQLRGVTVFSMKQLILAAGWIANNDRTQQQYDLLAQFALRQARSVMNKIKIDNVFFWATDNVAAQKN